MSNMELYIRSQDKRRLMKASNIYLDEEIEYDNGKYAIKCGTIDIGYYTFYRALEVLDEIQSKIKSKQLIETKNAYGWSSDKLIECRTLAEANYVYEMPKE